MKKALLINIMSISFISSLTLAMQKPIVSLPKELVRLIDTYRKAEPALERIRLWLAVPGNEKLDNNPLFLEALIYKLSEKFGKDDQALYAILLNTPGSVVWLQTKLAQEEQKLLAQRGVAVEPQQITEQLAGLLRKTFDKNDEKVAFLILKNFPEIQKKMPNENFVSLAVQSNFVSVVELLILQRSPLINKMNNKGLTPLFIAVLRKNSKLVKILLSGGANPNMPVKFDEVRNVTPLMMATDNNGLEMMNFLIEAGARVNAQDGNGNTALMRAFMQRPSNEAILLLLNNGTDLQIKNKEGDNALMIVLKSSQRIDFIQELLNQGARITPEALETAQQLPDNNFKTNVLQILQEKQENPGKIFGEFRLPEKL